jgi:hypothetical protein
MYLNEFLNEPKSQAIPPRCKTPKLCPIVQNAVEFNTVAGVRMTNHGGRAWTVKNVEQAVPDALTRFVRDAQSFVFLPAGLVLVSLRSMGAHNCRCISGTDTLSGHAFGRAIDISGWTFREQAGAGPERVVIYENLVRRQQWLPLHRVGACLHLNFGQVLDWAYNEAHENHFHVEIKDSPAQRWRFVDRCLSFTLGASLQSLGWVSSRSAHAAFAPGPDIAQARVRASSGVRRTSASSDIHPVHATIRPAVDSQHARHDQTRHPARGSTRVPPLRTTMSSAMCLTSENAMACDRKRLRTCGRAIVLRPGYQTSLIPCAVFAQLDPGGVSRTWVC